MKKYSKMVELNQKESQEKIDRAIQAIRKMVEKEEQVMVCSLVKRTGLSRAFFYKNEKVKNALQAAKKKQEGKCFEQKKKVILDKAMEKQVLLYEKQLEKLRNENEQLRKENSKMEKSLKKKELNFIHGL